MAQAEPARRWRSNFGAYYSFSREEKKSFRDSATLSQSFSRQIHYAPQTSIRDSAWLKGNRGRTLTTGNVRYHLDEIICREITEKGVGGVERKRPPTRFRRTKLARGLQGVHRTHAYTHTRRLMVIAHGLQSPSNFLGEQFEALMPQEVALYRVSTNHPICLPACLQKQQVERCRTVCEACLRCKLPPRLLAHGRASSKGKHNSASVVHNVVRNV